MVVTISLNDILIFVISVVGIALLVYLFVVINNINSILKNVRYIFNKQKDNIDNTITSLPEIGDNIRGITGEVKEGVHSLIVTAETIEKNITQPSRLIAGKTEIALDCVRILSDIIKVGTNYFKKK